MLGDIVLLTASAYFYYCNLTESFGPNFSMRSPILVFSFSPPCVSFRPFWPLVADCSSRPKGKLSKMGMWLGPAVLPWLAISVSLRPELPGRDCSKSMRVFRDALEASSRVCDWPFYFISLLLIEVMFAALTCSF